VESSPGQLKQQDSTPITRILKTNVKKVVHELQSSLSVKEHIQLPFCVVGLQKIQISIPFVSDHLPQKTKSHRHDPILINLVQSTIPHIPLCTPFHETLPLLLCAPSLEPLPRNPIVQLPVRQPTAFTSLPSKTIKSPARRKRRKPHKEHKQAEQRPGGTTTNTEFVR
jgi:hypothetical protein